MKFGIDLGGSHVAIGLVDENSEIIEKRTYYMNNRKNVSLEDYIVSSIVHGVNEILQSTKYNLCQIESIGIATPGNPKDGYIKNVVNLGIKEFNIAQKLRESFGSKNLKINIQNDGKCAALAEKYKGSLKDYNDCVFLCIGTDRVTGDCLGPYIGAQLSSHAFPMVHVYGTLSAPVHALNLTDTMQEIQKRHPGSLIIAIDSSLGQKKHLGYVTISNGALYPGAAVHKKLPPVGHIHITGIVNVSGVLEHLTLQTSRLSTVISIADQITDGILYMIPLISKCGFIQIL